MVIINFVKLTWTTKYTYDYADFHLVDYIL